MRYKLYIFNTSLWFYIEIYLINCILYIFININVIAAIKMIIYYIIKYIYAL